MIDYAIGTYEIELLSKNDLQNVFSKMQEVCRYVDTAIDYDNDYVLASVLRPETKVISKISSCHTDDYEFFVSNHLKYLKRDKIDLMLIHSNRGDWKPLALKMKDDKRFEKIGVSNFAAKDLQDYKDLTGFYPYANEIEINPLYTDIEAIEFCKQHDIKIISYAILSGKYRSWQTVAKFGLGNLIAYAQQYADIVILRANSETEADRFVDIVQNFDFGKATKISAIASSKAIEPMKYEAPKIVNQMFGKATYLRECGQNSKSCIVDAKEIILDKDLHAFEMLGDCKTYVRYLYQGDYYLGDWLHVEDDKFIAVYLWTKDGTLTKVTPEADRIEVVEYSVKSDD